jgi:UDP-N-acetylmuramoylalanine--D-glutamate ligase
MGLGLHGGALGNIEWLYNQGAQLTVTDLKTAQELSQTVEKLKKFSGIKLVLGEHREEDFTTADLVLRNPAVPRTSKYLEAARNAGVPIEMDSSLFWQASPSSNIIGVTGSKGKTTTASAIAVLLKAQYPQTVALGIDGVSPLKELPTILPDSPVVFELSSWRLEALDEHRVSPPVAVVTSIYRDHLNTYASFEEYIATKKVIVKYQGQQGIALLNADDPILQTWGSDIKGKLYWYSTKPLESGEGIFVRDGLITVRRDNQEEAVMPWDDLPLPSLHERRNLLPGILLARLYTISAETIKAELKHLQRLPHRLELVREHQGVQYINDSAATMPDATIAALQALKGKTIVHILGGSDKALLFDELAHVEAKAHLRALVFLPGTATAVMIAKLKEKIAPQIPLYEAHSMDEAVHQAAQVAHGGDVVLLSPAATSFGLFQHEFDRGNKFRDAVHALE